jgi:hypothetical protein
VPTTMPNSITQAKPMTRQRELGANIIAPVAARVCAGNHPSPRSRPLRRFRSLP